MLFDGAKHNLAVLRAYLKESILIQVQRDVFENYCRVFVILSAVTNYDRAVKAQDF